MLDFNLHSNMDRLKREATLFLERSDLYLHSNMDRLKQAPKTAIPLTQPIYIPIWID